MTRKLLAAATAVASLTGLSGLAVAQPVTGLYIGAGGGANFEQREFVKSNRFSTGLVAGTGRNSHDVGVAGVASIGYGLGNGLRFEIEGDYRFNRISPSSSPALVSSGGREIKYGPMVNVLFDLDIGSPYVFPYIGGGVGYSWEDRRRSSTGNISIAEPFNNTVSFRPGMLSSGGVDSSFAYQAIAGLSFPIPPVVGLSLTAEYRYFALTGQRTFTNRIGGTSYRNNVAQDYNHSLMLGLRYAFNVAPPPVEAAPAPAPSPQAPRTYLVFFDWDRADLTGRARQIIAEAARATTSQQVTRIEVSGHTDTTGTARYNQGLSVRRADVVAAELVRDGVPRAAISTQGFGFSRPLVATGPGVREPQNRRVEIVLR